MRRLLVGVFIGLSLFALVGFTLSSKAERALEAFIAGGTFPTTFTSAQLATAVTDETGSGAAVFATSPSLTTPALGVATGGGLILTSAVNHCLTVGPNGTTTAMFDINCSVANAANGLLITPSASGSGVAVTTVGGTNEQLTISSKGTGTANLNVTSSNTAVKLTVANVAKVTAGNTTITNAVSTLFTPPTAQTIAAGNTVAADACGGIKLVTAAGGVTTDTTNTFTAPAAANTGCVMWVYNSGAQTITLDKNALFLTLAGADVALLAKSSVAVMSDGTIWVQLTPVFTVS